ncbi:MAG: DUF5021 domain-containing protein [Oscillospiraceae bacterium]|nr:DUF5021 domain-containing protein [Oscillospiraceae bacterium]
MKRLAYLKSKKAFTLIELVVVIAIIGVLAGILIPVIVGAVRSANVASANTSATDIRKSVNIWLTMMDAKGHTINKTQNINNDPYITITADRGIYDIEFSDTFWPKSENEQELIDSLNDHLIHNLGYHELVAIGYLHNGAIAALAYCVNVNESTQDMPEFADFSRTDYWTGTNGIAADGTVIGTSPQILNG